MSGIDKGFLFGILTEVLRGNKRPTVKETIGVGVNEKAALSSDKKTALSFTSISILPW